MSVGIISLISMVLTSTRIDADNKLLVSMLKLDLSVLTYGICATICSVEHIYLMVYVLRFLVSSTYIISVDIYRR
jgi:hypothetical protein